jgi:phosphopantetheine adenylyltransferase
MFPPNLNNALENIYQMLLIKGILAVAIWSEPSKVPLINIPMSTARVYIKDPLVGQAVSGQSSLADVDVFKKSILKFKDVKSETITVTFEFNLAKEYTKFNRDIIAQIRTLYLMTEKRKEEIWNAITD